MAGLRKILKLYGRMKVGDILWLWDYAREEPVKASDMPNGSERWKASEKAKWMHLNPQPTESK